MTEVSRKRDWTPGRGRPTCTSSACACTSGTFERLIPPSRRRQRLKRKLAVLYFTVDANLMEVLVLHRPDSAVDRRRDSPAASNEVRGNGPSQQRVRRDHDLDLVTGPNRRLLLLVLAPPNGLFELRPKRDGASMIRSLGLCGHCSSVESVEARSVACRGRFGNADPRERLLLLVTLWRRPPPPPLPQPMSWTLSQR